MKKCYKELYELKKAIDKICVGEISTWKDRILIESLRDKNYFKLVKNVFLNVGDSDFLSLHF